MQKPDSRNILYISSVPVTLLYSGATFMYRLFEGNEHRLNIVQDTKLNEQAQLKNIPYYYFKPLISRLRNTRFREIYTIVNLAINYFFIPFKIRKIIHKEKPKAIVTVSNGLLWIMAYNISKKYKIPLFVIIHDDLDCYYSKKKISGKFIHRLFKLVYKQSKQRFCISQLMKEFYQSKYSVGAEVLYPLQGINRTNSHVKRVNNKISIAYAGSLDAPAYTEMIIILASELNKVEGTLLVFTNEFPEKFRDVGNIINLGFLHPDELYEKMQEHADAFFVPFGFEDWGSNLRLAFPSKVADYTLIAKPLLIWAPADCAVTKWFKELEVPVGVLIDKFDKNEVTKAIAEISDLQKNRLWGENSYSVGKEYFDRIKHQKLFFQKVNEVII